MKYVFDIVLGSHSPPTIGVVGCKKVKNNHKRTNQINGAFEIVCDDEHPKWRPKTCSLRTSTQNNGYQSFSFRVIIQNVCTFYFRGVRVLENRFGKYLSPAQSKTVVLNTQPVFCWAEQGFLFEKPIIELKNKSFSGYYSALRFLPVLASHIR